MARCTATNFMPTTPKDPPPPYSRYDCDGNRRGIYTISRSSNVPRTEVRTADSNGKKATLRCCTYSLGIAVAIVLCTFVGFKIFPFPLAASCTVQWGFSEPCTFVMQRLRSQILKWTSCRDCQRGGNKCLYSLKESLRSRENSTIRATHLNPNRQLIDDIEIEFKRTRNNSCIATAKSVSRAWLTLFDYGMNYCNLRNLVNGAGLDSDRRFMELTNEAICTQLQTAICA